MTPGWERISMNDPVLLDPSERPVVTAPKVGFLFVAHRLWNWIGIPGLTLLVLAIQTWVIKRQANIMEQQTSLMSREAEIGKMQEQLAARPNIVTSIQHGSSEAGKNLLWKVENKGPYSVRDLRLRVLHFKKFINLGWQDSISSEVEVSGLLEAGHDTTVNLGSYFLPYSIKDRANKDYTSVQGAEFYVVSLLFERQIDDKRYLYIQSFHMRWPGELPQELRLDLTAVSGPVATNCTMDAYAVELAYEFYKRNPLPFPVEPYNYHYLLGMPTATCLQTGPKSMSW